MKKFVINESEIKRILNLHVNATKRQYLPEQVQPTVQDNARVVINPKIQNFDSSTTSTDTSITAQDNTTPDTSSMLLPQTNQSQTNKDVTKKESYPACVQKFGDPTPSESNIYSIDGTGEFKNYFFFSNYRVGEFGSKNLYNYSCSGDKIVIDKTSSGGNKSNTSQPNPKVTEIQTKLKEIGYGDTLGNTGANKDGVDGKLGSKTLQSIMDALNKVKKPAEVKQDTNTPQQNKQDKVDTTIASTNLDIKSGNY